MGTEKLWLLWAKCILVSIVLDEIRDEFISPMFSDYENCLFSDDGRFPWYFSELGKNLKTNPKISNTRLTTPGPIPKMGLVSADAEDFQRASGSDLYRKLDFATWISGAGAYLSCLNRKDSKNKEGRWY